MTNDNRKVTTAEDLPPWDPAWLEAMIRQRVQETSEQVLNEELAAVLGAPRSDRVGAARQGDRHGTRERTVTTSVGPTPLTMPRGRLRTSTGTTAWPSTVIRRYRPWTTRGSASWRNGASNARRSSSRWRKRGTA